MQESVGQRINYIRKHKAYTLDYLAKRAGVSKSFLWEVENNRSGMSGERLLRVANALEASLEFLLRGQAAPENYRAPSIEIPVELSELAEELSLTYKQTLTLLEISSSIVARRSTKSREQQTTDDWRNLYKGVQQFLEEYP